jgi:hypothetical protein
MMLNPFSSSCDRYFEDDAVGAAGSGRASHTGFLTVPEGLKSRSGKFLSRVNFECYTTTVAAFVRLAMIRIMLRRLAATASS